ncbi:MAG TPA: hypothetical protein VLE43_11580 [Candidatus Saccharimonadia bacterium]|nr:hypothetical protein [Candidatus Saccharimonadia bacterium]HSJ01936.1 hypothetical protein [Verrucomicrobium sp.]
MSAEEEPEPLTFQKLVELSMRAPEELTDEKIVRWLVSEGTPEEEARELISRSR